MHIIIVGAGRTGTRLARYLVQEKHNVSLIESNEERARHASNRLDCLVLHDEGNSFESLKEAGIDKAQALVCVTDSDEVNMLICGLAASLYPGLLKIARVRNDDYVKLNQRRAPKEKDKTQKGEKREAPSFQRRKVLGIDYFIHPDVEAARAILNSLSHGALGNILDFTGTTYELGSITVAEGSAFDGFCLKDYRSLVKEDSLVTMVERDRGAEQECILPSGATVLERGDRVHILAREASMEHIFRLAGRSERPLRNIGIVGGGRIGALVAEGIFSPMEKRTGLFSFFRLFNRGSRRVVIVEQNYEICKDLAARFPEALVLNEDISDESFVTEERLGDLDLIITATSSQELNIVTALFLKSRGVRRAIAIVDASGYETIARQLGVDVVIPMQGVVVDTIVSNLTGKGIRGVHVLGDGTLEILEAEILPESPAAEKSITEFKISGGSLIILINRGGTSFIPRGDYVFKPDDKVIFIAPNGSEAELEKFFGAQNKK